MRTPVGSRFKFMKMVAAVLIPAILLAPIYSLAQDAMVGAKVSVDSDGKVKVNDVMVYRPDGEPLYADSGQIITDAAEAEEDVPWYEPTVGKFFIGLVVFGACVGIGFIVANNVNNDKYEWYYDSDCDCWKRRKVEG